MNMFILYFVFKKMKTDIVLFPIDLVAFGMVHRVCLLIAICGDYRVHSHWLMLRAHSHLCQPPTPGLLLQQQQQPKKNQTIPALK